MRSVLYRRHGVPADVLETVEVADPATPAPGQVTVRVLARPVHYGDLLGIAGRYRSGGDFSVPEGGVPVGFEGGGVVEAAGDGVGLKPGTRVAFFPGRGAWSELANVAAEYVTALPDSVSDDVGAQLHVNPLTAALLWRAVERAQVTVGSEVVVLTAAGSAVAKLIASILRAKGIDVVSLVRRDAGAQELASLFPDVPVVSTEAADWRARLQAVVGEKPVRAVLDPVGGTLASDLVTMLTGGGSLISYGDLSGEPICVPALSFSTRNIQVFGVSVGSWSGLPAEQRAEDITLSLKIAREHPELFAVAERYDLADVREAARHVEKPGKAGVVLLTSR